MQLPAFLAVFIAALALAPAALRASPPPALSCPFRDCGAPRERGEAADHRDRLPSTLDRSYGAISLIPLLGIGLSPAVSAGVSLDITRRLGWASLSLESRLLMSQTTEGRAAIGTMMGRAQVSACGHAGLFSLCSLVGLGQLTVLDDPTLEKIEEQDPWTASAGIRPGIEWRFGERLAFRGFVELHAVLGQPSVWVNGERFWAAPPVAGLAGIGMMLPL